jgi:hypothetical protein
MARLPASLIKKHHGDMKAAWAEYQSGPRRRPGRPRSDENVHPTASGAGVRAGRGLVAHIAAHGVVEYDGEAVGAILDGFLSELDRTRAVDTSTLYPPHSDDNGELRAWKQLAQERELGRELARRFGVALIHKRVDASSGSRHYAQAIARARQDSGMVSGQGGAGLGSPFASPRSN